MAIVSTDVAALSSNYRNPGQVVKSVMGRLEKKGKGIVLMHDIQPGTAKAVPQLLAELKAKGYKVVHMRPKFEVTTLAEYDTAIEKDVKGLALTPGSERPTTSVVRTIEDPPPVQPTAAKPAAAKK